MRLVLFPRKNDTLVERIRCANLFVIVCQETDATVSAGSYGVKVVGNQEQLHQALEIAEVLGCDAME